MLIQANMAQIVAIPGERILDPNLPGVNAIQDGLQISGLSVAQAVVGQPVHVIFTATNVGSGTFLGLQGGSIENGCDTITGLITTADGNVVAKLSSQQICVGPFGNALHIYEYEAVSLQSIGVLPNEYAGTDLSGALINAYVGSHTEFDAYNVGDVFQPNLNEMLYASITVTGQATPFPGSGGTTSPPSSGGGAPSTGGTSGTGGTPITGGTPSTGGTTPVPTPSLSSRETYVLLGAGALVLVGGYFFLKQGGL